MSDDKNKTLADKLAAKMLEKDIITKSKFEEQVVAFSSWPKETLQKIESFLFDGKSSDTGGVVINTGTDDKDKASLKVSDSGATVEADKIDFFTIKFDSDGNIVSKFPVMSREQEYKLIERFKNALREQQELHYGSSVEDGSSLKDVDIPKRIKNLVKDSSRKAEFKNDDELYDKFSLAELKDLKEKLSLAELKGLKEKLSLNDLKEMKDPELTETPLGDAKKYLGDKSYTLKDVDDGRVIKRTLNWESDAKWFKNQYPGAFRRSDNGVAKTSSEAVAGIAIKPGEPSRYVVVNGEKKREIKLTPDKMKESKSKTIGKSRGSLRNVQSESEYKKRENELKQSLSQCDVKEVQDAIDDLNQVDPVQKHIQSVSNGNNLTDILESDEDFKDLLKDYSFLDEQKNTTNLLEKLEEKIVEATRVELKAKRELFLLNRALEASYVAAEKEPVTLELPKPVEVKPTSKQFLDTFKDITESVLGKEYHSGDDWEKIYNRNRLRHIRK